MDSIKCPCCKGTAYLSDWFKCYYCAQCGEYTPIEYKKEEGVNKCSKE